MKTLQFLLLSLFSILINAQVGIGTTAPHASSILHLNSTNSGLLIPRMTSVQKYSIVNPATGLLIYQTDITPGFWYYTGTIWTTFGSSSTTYTFNNALTLTGSNAQLGGELVKTTTIDNKDYDLIFKTTSTASYPGEIEFEGKNRTILKTKFNSNYIEFGNDFPYYDTTLDGSTFSDILGATQTVDIIAGFQGPSSPSAGNCVKIGSIEYIYDDQNALTFVNADLIPKIDQTTSFGQSIGASSRRWASIYANNGVIQTSDIRYKKNIKPLKYGLNEILALNTITYNWKDNKVGLTTIPENLQKVNIGFSAQNLLEVMPEVVETHSWVPADEKGNFNRVENDKLGVNYSEIIPVLVNAIKEQQKQIEELKIKLEKFEN